MLVLLLLATSLSGIASDAGLTSGRASASTLVTDIKVVSLPSGVEIHILADRPLRPRTRRLHDPERFVVDLQDAFFAGDNRAIDVDSADIKSVRIAPLYQQEGRVTRVVIDLAAPRQVDLTPAGDTLILKLAATDAAAAERPDSLPQRASAGESGTQLPSAGSSAQYSPTDSVPQEDTLVTQELPRAKRGDDSPGYSSILSSQVSEGRREDMVVGTSALTPAPRFSPQPTPGAISEPAAKDPPALISVVAVEKSAPEPTLAAAENSPSDALIYGVGVTGQGKDPTLGVDVERILGPGKQNKKKKDAESGGGAEGSLLHSFHLSGEAIGGYYRADGNNGILFHDASPVASLHLDASGYLYHPGFLSFSVKPQGSLGRQSSEGMFPDGQGVAATTTFLGGGATPLTLSYSRLNRKLMTFGPLDRLAGLEANTFQDSLGASWTLRLKRLPEMVFNFSKYSDSYQPLAALAPQTSDAGRLGSVDMRENVIGWNLQTHYKLERSSQDMLDILDPAQPPYLYQRKDQEARASADRNFGRWLSVSFLAGATKSRNLLQDRPFDQSYRFLNGNSMFRPTKKLTLAFHGSITNNVLGASLERSAGNVSTPEQPFLLVPSTARLQLVNYSVSVQYALTKDLHFHGDALRETSSPQQSAATVTPESRLTSAQAGVSWSRRLRFVRFQSHYAANIGSFLYGSSGSSRSSGHKAELGATVGSLHTLELTAGLQGNMQGVAGSTYMRDRSWGANLTLSRTFHEQWKLQATYNRTRDRYDLLDQTYSSDGNGFSLTLFHPRLDLTASHNLHAGLTFQADPRLQYVSSTQAGMLLGAFPGTLMVPAGADWSSASASFRPFGKFRARGTWLRSRQQLQGAVNNRYTEWEASAGYQLRSLNFDAGYIFHDQEFGLDLSQRNRLFVRVVRDFTIF